MSCQANQHMEQSWPGDHQERGEDLDGLCPAVQGEGGLPLLDMEEEEAHLCYHDTRG